MTNGVVECFRCHTPISESSKFCSSCGADVSGGDGPTSTSSVDIVRERLQRIIEGKYRIERLLGRHRQRRAIQPGDRHNAGAR